MSLAKRTYALPAETLDRFERAVGPGQRSAKIAELIDGWLEEAQRAQLRREIEEGCREMWDLYREVAEEWRPLDEELDRAFL